MCEPTFYDAPHFENDDFLEPGEAEAQRLQDLDKEGHMVQRGYSCRKVVAAAFKEPRWGGRGPRGYQFNHRQCASSLLQRRRPSWTIAAGNWSACRTHLAPPINSD